MMIESRCSLAIKFVVCLKEVPGGSVTSGAVWILVESALFERFGCYRSFRERERERICQSVEKFKSLSF